MKVIRLVLFLAILCCTNGIVFAQSRVSATAAINSVTHGTCSGTNGSTSVQLTATGPAGSVIGGYTIVLNKDGVYYNTITNGAIQSSLSIARVITNLPPGVYTISGSIIITNPANTVSYGMPSFLSKTFYLGYQGVWSETREMTPQSLTSTVLQNIATPTQTYAGARLQNSDILDSWFTVTPFFNSGNATNRSILVPLFYAGALGTFNPATNIDYLEFRKAGSSADGVYYKLSQGSTIKLDGVTFTSTIRVHKVGNTITLYAQGADFPITVGNGADFFSTINNSNITLTVHTKVINDGVNVATNLKCNSGEIYANLFDELDGAYYTMKNGKLRFVFDQDYDTQNSLKFNIYNSYGMLQKTQANFPAVLVTYGDNYLTLDLTTNPTCLGQGIFILEVISDKKEKTYLRFYNEYNSCIPQSEEYPGGPINDPIGG